MPVDKAIELRRQRFLPSWRGQRETFSQLQQVKPGITRSFGFGREINRRDRGDRLHNESHTARLQSADDGGGKAVPTGFAGTGEIDHTAVVREQRAQVDAFESTMLDMAWAIVFAVVGAPV